MKSEAGEISMQRLRTYSTDSVESASIGVDMPESSMPWTVSKYVPILYVLFMEFLAISLTKSLIPKMLVDSFGSKTYFIVGTSHRSRAS
jgi:hypothetical protein